MVVTAAAAPRQKTARMSTRWKNTLTCCRPLTQNQANPAWLSSNQMRTAKSAPHGVCTASGGHRHEIYETSVRQQVYRLLNMPAITESLCCVAHIEVISCHAVLLYSCICHVDGTVSTRILMKRHASSEQLHWCCTCSGAATCSTGCSELSSVEPWQPYTGVLLPQITAGL